MQRPNKWNDLFDHFTIWSDYMTREQSQKKYTVPSELEEDLRKEIKRVKSIFSSSPNLNYQSFNIWIYREDGETVEHFHADETDDKIELKIKYFFVTFCAETDKVSDDCEYADGKD